MRKNDSYALLEVFFGDRSMSSMNMAGTDQQCGVKREREEDNDVGLSLDADEPPSATTSTKSKTPRRSCGLSKWIRPVEQISILNISNEVCRSIEFIR